MIPSAAKRGAILTALKRAAPLIPHAAILLGIYVFSSAWAAVAGYYLGVAGVALLEWRGFYPRRLLTGWHPGWGAGFVLGGLAAGGALLLLWPLLDLDYLLPAGLAYVGLWGFGWKAFLFTFALVNPVVEELFWRGYLAGDRRGPELNDLLFAGFHVLVLRFFLPWPWVVTATVILFLAAWTWRLAAVRTGGLLLPLASHLAADLGITAALLLKDAV